ncbi:dipeptide/oligopeptide/nickel ABC transporter permease/ATP-binding protein [Arthrobacter sp. W4I7]|uniref:dipeptide/oligopeptide/nickel ABC transporter permease/ATP-binding protein n=1 Tax=Arthrobacter sp. W4I7 TaxID=3042296 RepID=UPI002783EF69|nr:dipeptide/oligopeptide/nickel ABC transporter permease/ATP-binding protein [Arthrobacter sp. W4I7]MDQ0693082.1 peptide/nickel transport system permease protein [Arthrobacter sp. W4I7]
MSETTTRRADAAEAVVVVDLPAPPPSTRARVLRDFMRKPLGVASALFVVAMVLASILAPWIAPADPFQQNLMSVKQGPSAAFPLGTDSLGRDVLSRLLYGGAESIFGVLQAVLTALVVGIPLGVATGFLGGRFDKIVMRAIDIKMAIPGIIVTLSVLAIFNNSMAAAMVTFGVLASGNIIRVIRSTVLGVREELYVDAARVIGLGSAAIIFRHILPRTIGVIIVQTAMLASIALGVQTGLAFLGFGPPPPAPTWGGMVSEASGLLRQQPWMMVPTAGLITAATLALGLLGDAARDVNSERLGRAKGARRRRPAVVTAPAGKPEPSALLSVRGLTVAFDDGEKEIVVVQGASFDIHPGETVGLVGESGSGKSVTALALLGLLGENGRITAGSIHYRGTDITSHTQAQYRALRGREMAMISQEPMVALDPAFRVGWQIAEVVMTHRRCTRKEARDHVLALLTAVKLPDPEKVARLYPHQISGGMAQRIVIAMALAGEPKLLIADEPTTALDVTVQAEILDLLHGLQRERDLAVLFVTHDWAVVADICSRAVVMYAGEVVEKATVQQMFDRPMHPYTQGLLDSSPHLAVKGQPLPTIGGIVPPPLRWPTGCHFSTRCPLATDACRAGAIVEIELDEGRTSRCLRVDELLEARS